MRKTIVLLLMVFSLLPAAGFAQDPKLKVPDDVKKIIRKLSSGQDLTAEEQKKLDEFQAGKSEEELDRIGEELLKDKDFVDDVKKSQVSAQRREGDDLPRPDATVALGREVPPAEDAFLAIVRAVQAEAAGKITAADRSQLDKSVADLKSAPQVSNVAMVYLFNDEAEPLNKALYLAATSVLADPKDAADISNLGVALKNAEDYRRSFKVLLYADQLQPQSPVILSNLGWTIAYLGDFATAKARFNVALLLDPEYANAMEGLGTLAQVEHDSATASKYLLASLLRHFSPTAAKAEAKNKQAPMQRRAKEEAEKIKQNPISKPQPPASTEPEDPDTYEGARWADAIWSPFDQPRQSFDKPPVPDFIDGAIAKASQEGKNDEHYYAARTTLVNAQGEAFMRALAALPEDPLHPAPRVEGGQTVYPRSYEKEVFALRDLERMVILRSGIIRQNFDKEQTYLFSVGHGIEIDNMGKADSCPPFAAFSNASHATYYQSWQAMYARTLPELDKYYRYSAYWIQAIADPKIREEENERRAYVVRALYHTLILDWGGWSSFINPGPCGSDKPKPEARGTVDELTAKNGKLKIFPEPYGSCHVPTGSIDGGFIALDATCESLKLTLKGEILKFSAERKFGEKESDDITTFRVTAGAEKALDLKLNGVKYGTGKLGAEVSYFIQTQNGHVLDQGVDSQIGFTGKINAGDDTQIVIKGGIDGRITAESGAKVSPQNASVSLSSAGVSGISKGLGDAVPVKVH